jgi:squalene synthase HpnC
MGRAGGENFRVASRLLPGSARRHLLAFYGFARLTDEIGDSYTGDRLAALDWLQDQTDAGLSGSAVHPLVAPATTSVLELGADPAPLYELIAANRMDQSVKEYDRFEDLLGYCAKSANPVGRLVLAAFGYRDDHRIELSDAVCTGLQLVEHWQDVHEDALVGRVYIPAEDLKRFGVDAADLVGPRPASSDLRALMVFEVARARTWLSRGEPLVGTLSGSARWAVAGFVAGGRAALDSIAARDFDVLSAPSRPSPVRIGRHLVGLGR